MDAPTIIIGFASYVAVLMAIGWVAWRRTRNAADYVLGGRSLGRWVTALSAGASDMSGWLLLGLPGFAYVAGLQATWLAIGLFIGSWLNWILVAPGLRQRTETEGDALTLPGWFRVHFEELGKAVGVVSALLILFFYFFYTASGLVAGGKLFESVFGMDYQIAVIIGATVILLYTAIGGFLAVSWTDLFQGLLMLAALLIVPVAASMELGWGGITSAVHAHNPALLDFLTDSDNQPLTLVAILSLLGWGLGYFGQPHILARFMAIENARALPAARRIAVGWTGLTLAGAVIAGLAGIAVIGPTLQGGETEKVFMLLIQTLFHPLIAGILLAAILAAIMSTADSQLLVASTVLEEDFFRALQHPDASEQQRLRAGRLAVIVLSVAATGLAMDPDSQVLDLVAYAWAGFGATFGPVILLMLWWPRLTAPGAVSGMIAGALTVVVWRHMHGGWFDLYELVPGFIAAILAAILISRLSR